MKKSLKKSEKQTFSDKVFNFADLRTESEESGLSLKSLSHNIIERIQTSDFVFCLNFETSSQACGLALSQSKGVRS